MVPPEVPDEEIPAPPETVTGTPEPVAPVERIDPAAGRLDRLRGRLARSQNTVGQGLLGLLGAGDLVVGWLLLRQAEIAVEKVDSAEGKDKDFYTGKIAAAKFFASQVLPRLASERAIAEATDNSLMDVPESAF